MSQVASAALPPAVAPADPALSRVRRPHFVHNRDVPGARLFIEPLEARTTGEALIVVSRRRERADGTFDGVINVNLDPGYFESVYRAATTTEGAAITLLRDDATVLAR